MSIREHIIEGASNMFFTYGIKSIRMDDIASNLGISKRTIYEHFSDKENLLIECLRYRGHQIEQVQRELTKDATNVIEEMLILMKHWDTDTEANHKVMTNLMKFYPKVYQKMVDEKTKKAYVEMKRKLNKAVELGIILPDINFDLAMSVFSYTIFGIISQQKSILSHTVSEKEAFKYVVTYFFRGIATEKGIKLIDDFLSREE